MVVFSFLPQNFWRWLELTNAIVSFYDCGLSGGDNQMWQGTQTLLAVIEKLFALTGDGDAKTCPYCLFNF